MRSDVGFPLQDDVAGVEFLRHVHDGDAGMSVTVEDGPVDGRGPPVRRQQRRMDVDTAVKGDLQDRLRENLPVGRHDYQFRRQVADTVQRGLVAEFQRLEHRQPPRKRVLFHRGRREFVSAVFGPVRLGEYAANLMTRLRQGAQRRRREIRRTHEQYPHSVTPLPVIPVRPAVSGTLPAPRRTGNGLSVPCTNARRDVRFRGRTPAPSIRFPRILSTRRVCPAP